MSNEHGMPRLPIEEAAFSAEEMGRAAYLAAKPGNRMLELSKYPRLAGYFGLDSDLRDEMGRQHTVCVINPVTYRVLVLDLDSKNWLQELKDTKSPVRPMTSRVRSWPA